MKIIRDMTAEYIQKTIRLLDSWYLKAMANFSELAKAGIGVVPDLTMRLDEYRNGKDLIIYLQKKIHGDNINLNKKIKKMSIVKDKITPDIISKSKSAGCQAVISYNKILTTIKII